MLCHFCSDWSFCLFLCFVIFEGGTAMNLSGPMVMNVCVFSMVRLWPSSACHRLYSRWRSLLIHVRQQPRLTNTIHVDSGGSGRGGLLFPSISRVQVQFVVFWRDYVCISILCVENLICNMSNKNKVRLSVFLCFSTDLERKTKPLIKSHMMQNLFYRSFLWIRVTVLPVYKFFTPNLCSVRPCTL